MIIVIFRAEIAELDDEYHATATRLRDLALADYGCVEFLSFTEGNHELAISYWPSRSHIKKWRSNPEHVEAQGLGKSRWYKSFQVEIAEVESRYGTNT